MNDQRTGREIAIIGIGCRFGGGADDLQRFWQMQLEGRNAFETVPPDRWDITSLYDPNVRAADKTYADKGAFIQDITSFPAVFLQIPPRRVEVMDPQQRMLLECSLQAIDDAGLTPDEVPRRTGVYAGITASEFRTLIGARTFMQSAIAGDFGEKPENSEALSAAVNRVVKPRPFTAAGSLGNMAAATISQELGLTGPAYAVDAACSSALIALNSAVSALRAGEVDAAIAGGAYVNLGADHYIAFSRIGAMSKAGVCRPFDTRADGFVQGDGAGMILLKRLADAERDGDRVYAVLHGMALNNDGGGQGPMAPVKSGQIDCINLAWNDAGMDAKDLGYVEAHGTGTSVGDQVEFDGLNATLGKSATDATIGSAKANVGHTMSAAGIAGVIRAAMAIHHKVRPPMANFETPKEGLALEGSPFRIETEVREWQNEERLACVSAFGFGGTNGHCVLGSAPTTVPVEEKPELVLISAPNELALRDLSARTAAALRQDSGATVAGVARAWAKREEQEMRLGVVASTTGELISKLEEFGSGGQSLGTAFGLAGREVPKVAFLYPGQGAQRVDMLADLRTRFPIVDETLAAADAAAIGVTELPVSHYLYPSKRQVAVSPEIADAELTATQNCQPALLAVGAALTRLLAQAGVTPGVVAGHSVGEFTAASAGGVLSLEDAIRWAAERGHAMATGPIPEAGAMAAIVADRATVEGLLVDGAVVANVNHPKQTVVSGLKASVEAVARAAEAKQLKTVRLNVSHGFHSPIFDKVDF
ncbi:MAG: acyl transferase domain-containing protein, partial [Bradymonadia bacterium]